MPYASRAQQKKFHQLLKEGKIKKSTVDEFDKKSEGLDLPEKAKPKNLDDLKKIAKIKKV